MMIGETVRVAFSSIRDHKLRALLTMLGIIIGVGAVIAVVAIGTGAQRAIAARIEALGANLLSIYPGPVVHGRAGQRCPGEPHRQGRPGTHATDAHLLSGVEPEMQRALQVKYGNKNFNINILGTTPNFAEVRNFQVTYGRMFTQGDDGAHQRYAVLGSAVPVMFNVNPAALINQTILIRGQPFVVIGMLSEKGSAGSFENPDERIVIPLSTAQYRIFGSDRLRSIAVLVRDGVVAGRREWWTSKACCADSTRSVPAATTTSRSGTSRTFWPPSRIPPRASSFCWAVSRWCRWWSAASAS